MTPLTKLTYILAHVFILLVSYKSFKKLRIFTNDNPFVHNPVPRAQHVTSDL